MGKKYKYSIEVKGKKVGTDSEQRVADYLLGISPALRKKMRKKK